MTKCIDLHWIQIKVELPYCLAVGYTDKIASVAQLRDLNPSENRDHKLYLRKLSSRHIVMRSMQSVYSPVPRILRVHEFWNIYHNDDGYYPEVIEYFFRHPECLSHTSPKMAFYWWQYQMGLISSIPYVRKRHRNNGMKNAKRKMKKYAAEGDVVKLSPSAYPL